jgi:O-antigen/teichoic acid export membrane protein
MSASARHASSEPAVPELGHDMIFVLFSRLLYLLTRLAVPPLVLAHVGLTAYGMWTTCFILISYIGMSASGFAVVYVRFVAIYHARGDVPAISRLLSTGTLAMGTLASGLLGVLWFAMPTVMNVFNVIQMERETVGRLWFGACAIFLLDASIGVYGYVLHGLQKIRRERQIWIVAYLLETVCIILFLHLGLGLYGMLAAFAVRYTFSISAAALVVRRALPGLSIGPCHFDWACLRLFFGFGSWVQVGGLISIAMQSADRIIAGLAMGPTAAAIMDLGGKLPSTSASLSSSVSMVAFPEAALSIYADCVRMTACLASMTLPPLACLAPLVISVWLGPRADAATLGTIMSWVAVSTHLHLLTAPASSVFRGLGKIGNEYVYHGLRITALVAGTVVLWLRAPLQPALLASVLGTCTLVSAALYLIVSHRRLTRSFGGLVRLYMLPFLAPYALGLVTAYIASSWPLAPQPSRSLSLMHLASAILVYTGAMMYLSWWLILDGRQRHACRRVWRQTCSRLFPTQRG